MQEMHANLLEKGLPLRYVIICSSERWTYSRSLQAATTSFSLGFFWWPWLRAHCGWSEICSRGRALSNFSLLTYNANLSVVWCSWANCPSSFFRLVYKMLWKRLWMISSLLPCVKISTIVILKVSTIVNLLPICCLNQLIQFPQISPCFHQWESFSLTFTCRNKTWPLSSVQKIEHMECMMFFKFIWRSEARLLLSLTVSCSLALTKSSILCCIFRENVGPFFITLW